MTKTIHSDRAIEQILKKQDKEPSTAERIKIKTNKRKNRRRHRFLFGFYCEHYVRFLTVVCGQRALLYVNNTPRKKRFFLRLL